MSDEKVDYFKQFRSILNKLKKKRILPKPNITEASQQFENLGKVFEREDLPQYAGLCYHAAAKCQHSMGNNLEEGLLLLKSSRQFMSSYLKHFNDQSVSNEAHLHHSYMLYKNCLTRLEESVDQSKFITEAVIGGIILEMANNFTNKMGNVEEGCLEYEKALKFISSSPVEKINCFQKLVASKIEIGDYSKSLDLITEIVDEAKNLPDTGLKEDILRNSEITRTFLLLILQPAPQQISPAAASALEKYAWVETLNSNEISELQTNLNNDGLSILSKDLFLKLQSLVMACQYCDLDSFILLESDLIPYLNNIQRMLLQILIKQYKV